MTELVGDTSVPVPAQWIVPDPYAPAWLQARVLADVRRVTRDPDFTPASPQELCGRVRSDQGADAETGAGGRSFFLGLALLKLLWASGTRCDASRERVLGSARRSW